MPILVPTFGEKQKPPLGMQISLAHPLAKGLVGAWVLNEGARGTVLDASPCANHGILSGGAAFRAGPYGPDVPFGARSSTDRIALPDSSSLDIANSTGALSILSAWRTADTSDYGMIFGAFKPSSPYTGFGFTLNVNYGSSHPGRLGFSSNVATNWSYWASPSNLADGNWHIGGLTYAANDSHAYGYADGLALGIDVVGVPAGLASYRTPRAIGSKSGGGDNTFNGDIAFVWLWNVVLPSDKMFELMARPFSLFRPTRKWWFGVGAGAAPAATGEKSRQLYYIS
jgi:hypothetical protein